MRVLDPTTTYTYIPLSERGKDVPVMFELRHITAREEASIHDLGMTAIEGGSEIRVLRGAQEFAMLRAGVAGIRNWQHADGSLVEIKTTGPRNRPILDDSTLDKIPADIRAEIARVIDREGDITETDRKN